MDGILHLDRSHEPYPLSTVKASASQLADRKWINPGVLMAGDATIGGLPSAVAQVDWRSERD